MLLKILLLHYMQVKVKVVLRLKVCSQSVHLGAKPLEVPDELHLVLRI
jgi:hypothetical protein